MGNQRDFEQKMMKNLIWVLEGICSHQESNRELESGGPSGDTRTILRGSFKVSILREVDNFSRKSEGKENYSMRMGLQ